jgi:outer membrane biosynthesis protein TonB
MSDTPKFEVIDRRKIKAEEEQENQQQPAAKTPEPAPAPPTPPASGGGPRLVVSEPKPKAAAEAEAELPPAPTAQESREQKTAYDASAQRLEDIVRAQNPAAGVQPPISFENLVQQFYVSAMIQMGAGAQEGQRPRIDILGARTTIDLLGILAEKTRGNLTEAEDKTLQTVLFEVRMAFMELTSMISLQSVQPPPPPPDKN